MVFVTNRAHLRLGAVLLLFAVGSLLMLRYGESDSSQRVAVPSTSADPKHLRPLVDREDAKQMRTRLASLPGVGTADMSLGEDDQTSAAVNYAIEMREDSDDAAVLRVVESAYRIFDREFADTSASVEISRLNDHVTLQTRKPTPTAAQVLRIARYAFTEAAADDLVVVFIQARDDRPRPLLGDVRVNLLGGRSRTPADVLARLDAIDPTRIPPNTGVGVTDDAGDGLTGDVGLPTKQARALWAGLIDHPFPDRVGFDLSADVGQDGEPTWFINATIDRTAPDETDPADLAALLRHTLDVMRETGDPFRFSGVTSPTVEYSIWFDSTECKLTGPDWLDEVKQEYFNDGQCG